MVFTTKNYEENNLLRKMCLVREDKEPIAGLRTAAAAVARLQSHLELGENVVVFFLTCLHKYMSLRSLLLDLASGTLP